MKCIITGGAGFIGSNLAEKLVKMGHRVTVIDNLTTGRKKNLREIIKKIKFINHDISINNEVNSSFDLVALENINTEGFIWPYLESLAFYVYSFFMQDEVQ